MKELDYQEKKITDSWNLSNDHYDKDTLLATIINKGAMFEPLYTNPDYFYTSCQFFWGRWARTFEKWFNAFDIEYNPLENYDRYELAHDDILDNGTNEATTETSGNDSNTTTNSVSAFDSNDFSNANRSNSSSNNHEDISASGTNSNDRDYDHTAHIHGNIGTVTAQDMLEQELKIQSFNIYEHIADIFLKEMTLTVY